MNVLWNKQPAAREERCIVASRAGRDAAASTRVVIEGDCAKSSVFPRLLAETAVLIAAALHAPCARSIASLRTGA